MRPLIDHAVEQYEKIGFCASRELLTTDQVSELRERLARIARGEIAFPKESMELEPNCHGHYGGPSIRKINHCAENDPVFQQVANLDSILNVVERLIGPHIKLFGSQAFMKPPGGVEKPYHQDSPYFPIEPMSLTTCWIALDNASQENGCLWFIPGSHRLGLLPHDVPWQVGDRTDMRISEQKFDRSTEVPMILQSGDCSFHHSLLLHASRQNDTDQPRRGIAFHYMSSKSKWTDQSAPKPNFPLLRGREFPGCV